MNAQPDTHPLTRFLQRTVRRVRWIRAAEGATLGLAGALIVALIGWLLSWPVAQVLVAGICLAGAGTTLRSTSQRIGIAEAAALVDARTAARNLIVTAAEIDRGSGAASYARTTLLAHAAARIADVKLAAVAPARTALHNVLIAAALWISVVGATAVRPAQRVSAVREMLGGVRNASIASVEVEIKPPPYLNLRARTLHNPSTISAPVGSIIRVTAHTAAADVAFETLEGRTTMTAMPDGGFTAQMTAAADGYIAIESRTNSSTAADRRLMGLLITPDLRPRARITAPGRDIFTTDSVRTIDVELEAEDDYALAGLTLRYTKVSGSGEKFAFTEGSVPLSITRSGTRNWRARGALRLGALGLVPGDMVVYRGVVRDQRPGADASESDAFIVEITAPGSEAAAGFAADDETDRYGLSQEMLILKTERLIARASGLAPDSLNDQSMLLAAEQRAIRADFVFMMGGELAEEVIEAADANQLNEEAEAAGEEDLAAGRGVNRGRVALVQAIRAMSQANASLSAHDLPKALLHERAALASLQAAFSRTRYILRALTQRERLDFARRLTGNLADASGSRAPAATAAQDSVTMMLRNALSGIATLRAEGASTSNASARAAALSSAILRADPKSESLRAVAQKLNSAATSFADNKADAARRDLDAAASSLTAILRGRLPAGSRNELPLEAKRLNGALSDAVRRAGGIIR